MEGRGLSLANLVDRFDARVDAFFDPLRGRGACDRVAYLASELADFSVGWHIAGATLATVSPTRELHALRLAATLGAESILVNGVIKPMFRRPRPDGWQTISSAAPRRPKTASFPSGHASSATVAATLLTAAAPRLTPLWWGAGAVVAGSRIYTRMHHASDVAAGVVVGVVIAAAAKRLAPL